MENNKYTPKKISEEKLIFSIPLYQRLFEWEEKQIVQLLNDLKNAFEKDQNNPYYLGLLTVYNQKSVLDLVDGQQRFTVLMLLGIVLKDKYEEWNKFLIVNDSNLARQLTRLTFFAREKDKNYLKRKLDKESINEHEYENKKMKYGIDLIEKFITNFDDYEKIKMFSIYIFEKLTFFISFLPDKYELQDLNRYFEAMNATGRGLEKHEILKVELLRKVQKKENIGVYTKIWNLVSDMNKLLISQYDKNNLHAALQNINNTDELLKIFKIVENDKENNNTIIKSIKEINASNNRPIQQSKAVGVRAILSFSEFLLHVLWLQVAGKEKKDFFNVQKLLETFSNFLNEEIDNFFINLLKFRIIFDYFIVRISNDDSFNTSYILEFDNDKNSDERKKIIQYMSMLYVSTSMDIWLPFILNFVKDNPQNITVEVFLEKMKTFDNKERQGRTNISLKYGEIDRYWFWRLDYYLWENELIKDKKDDAILKYSFKSNRSIEHIHPQDQTNNEQWTTEQIHSFGNLAMISSSFNSTQKNDNVHIKFARIKEQCERNAIESLKMYEIFKEYKDESNWNIKNANDHAEKMIDVLMKSFPKSDEYSEIYDALEEQKKLLKT